MRAYERLLKYVQIPSASDPESKCTPSSEGIWKMARLLKAEMEIMGLTDVVLDDNAYLFASIPSNTDETAPVLGFIAHMDVSSDAPSENIKTRIEESYDGGEIVLNGELGIAISPDKYPSLKRYTGKDLIVTDGTTLLGADDKAGIAEILTMAEILLSDSSIKHGKIVIGFTPDEEIGRGADHFDVERFGADFAYTVDGGAFGEISYESFNAVSAEAKFTGVGVHPGTSKNVMVNAQLLAMEFFSMLPIAERPEYTSGREGFFLLTSSGGSVESSYQHYILRDHEYAKVKRRMEIMNMAAEFINGKYGKGSVEIEFTETYRNMAEEVIKYPFMTDIAVQAVRDAGGEAEIVPIRGGTDGSRLSYMGLPCPNLGTGSHSHHGRAEYACVQAMDSVVSELLNIAIAYGKLGSIKKK